MRTCPPDIGIFSRSGRSAEMDERSRSHSVDTEGNSSEACSRFASSWGGPHYTFTASRLDLPRHQAGRSKSFDFTTATGGINGREFAVYNFTTTAWEGACIGQARRNDSRVTRVNRLLRATGMDELPQLFSVLGGQMSLVG